MTMQPFQWPQAPAGPPVAPLPAGSRLDRLDTAGVAATMAPLLGRAVGCRVGVQPLEIRVAAAMAATDDATIWWQVARLAVAGDDPLTLCVSSGLAAGLTQAVFGGGMEVADAGGVDALPPGNATWAVIAGLLATGCAQALAAADPDFGSSAVPAAPSSRAVASCLPPGATLLCFDIDIGGSGGQIVLVDSSSIVSAPPVEAVPPPEPEQWRRQVRARAMAVDLPVALHLDDLRLPLAEVSALQAGDIVAIARPRTFAVVVAGRRIGSVAASSIAGPSPVSTPQQPTVQERGGA